MKSSLLLVPGSVTGAAGDVSRGDWARVQLPEEGLQAQCVGGSPLRRQGQMRHTNAIVKFYKQLRHARY
jgi:hypothetical protein